MVSCWALEPADRPNFQSLEKMVSFLLIDLKDYLPLVPELSDTKKSNYIQQADYRMVEDIYKKNKV